MSDSLIKLEGITKVFLTDEIETHALSGIAEAFMDHVPMLVLGCGIRTDTGKAFQLHDVDQVAIVSAVAKGTFQPRTGQELYDSIRSACLLARSGAPGPGSFGPASSFDR